MRSNSRLAYAFFKTKELNTLRPSSYSVYFLFNLLKYQLKINRVFINRSDSIYLLILFNRYVHINL